MHRDAEFLLELLRAGEFGILAAFLTVESDDAADDVAAGCTNEFDRVALGTAVCDDVVDDDDVAAIHLGAHQQSAFTVLLLFFAIACDQHFTVVEAVELDGCDVGKRDALVRGAEQDAAVQLFAVDLVQLVGILLRQSGELWAGHVET